MLWLAATLIFAWRSYQAEALMPTLFDGKPHTVSEYLTVSERAVALFPFDQHLRDSRIFIRKQIEEQLAGRSDAAGQRGAASPDVRGGK